jgi:hypothetical protein
VLTTLVEKVFLVTAQRPADSSFGRLAVEVLAIGLRVGARMVDDPVPMVRRRVERAELQRNAAGIDDVVVRPRRNEDR